MTIIEMLFSSCLADYYRRNFLEFFTDQKISLTLLMIVTQFATSKKETSAWEVEEYFGNVYSLIVIIH